jgi:hypothetical protein
MFNATRHALGVGPIIKNKHDALTMVVVVMAPLGLWLAG